MTVRMAVYVAAPFAKAALVRALHLDLIDIGCAPTSRWAEATGPEMLDTETARAAIAQNDADVERSDVVLAVLVPAAGGEMFCEVTRALILGKPVVAVVEFRDVLSAWREGVARVRTVGDALARLRRAVTGEEPLPRPTSPLAEARRFALEVSHKNFEAARIIARLRAKAT